MSAFFMLMALGKQSAEQYCVSLAILFLISLTK